MLSELHAYMILYMRICAYPAMLPLAASSKNFFFATLTLLLATCYSTWALISTHSSAPKGMTSSVLQKGCTKSVKRFIRGYTGYPVIHFGGNTIVNASSDVIGGAVRLQRHNLAAAEAAGTCCVVFCPSHCDEGKFARVLLLDLLRLKRGAEAKVCGSRTKRIWP